MAWKVEKYDNNLSEIGVRVVDEVGNVICCNEPYYPTPLDPKHANLIAAAPAMRDEAMALVGNPDVPLGLVQPLLNAVEQADAAIAGAEDAP